jgi:hypothetical protein
MLGASVAFLTSYKASLLFFTFLPWRTELSNCPLFSTPENETETWNNVAYFTMNPIADVGSTM